MYPAHDIARVKALLAQKVSKIAIAKQLGISRRVIYHWIAAGYLDQALPTLRTRVRKNAKLDPFRELIALRLAAAPGLTAVQLFHEAKRAGYEGGITQVRAYVATLRKQRVSTHGPIPESTLSPRESIHAAVVQVA